MNVIIILGIIFTLWEGVITHLFPAHSQEYYQQAAQKWSTGIGPVSGSQYTEHTPQVI